MDSIVPRPNPEIDDALGVPSTWRRPGKDPADDGREVALIHFFRCFPEGATGEEVSEYWFAKILQEL